MQKEGDSISRGQNARDTARATKIPKNVDKIAKISDKELFKTGSVLKEEFVVTDSKKAAVAEVEKTL